MSPSVSLRQMDNLANEKYGVTGEVGVLVTQESMTDADAAKVAVNAKVYAPEASNAFKIDTTNIDMKRGIGKLCAVAISLYRHVSLRYHSLCNARNTEKGSPGATNTNMAKDSFRLLDLITEVQNVSMAIRKFRTTHG